MLQHHTLEIIYDGVTTVNLKYSVGSACFLVTCLTAEKHFRTVTWDILVKTHSVRVCLEYFLTRLATALKGLLRACASSTKSEYSKMMFFET